MRVQLIDGAQPSAVTAFHLSLHGWRDEIKAQLNELLEKDVIGKVDYPTQWCHPKNELGCRADI